MLQAPITIICIVIAIAQFIRIRRLSLRFGQHIAYLKAGVMSIPLRQKWRLMTSAFVHFSIYHLLMNIFSMWSLGSLLEPMFGPARYALIFFGAVLCGNLFVLAKNETYTMSGGLSGGIYGLLGAYVVLMISLGHASYFFSAQFLPTLLINLYFNFMPNVNWRAHLGGLAWGIVCANLMLRLML